MLTSLLNCRRLYKNHLLIIIIITLDDKLWFLEWGVSSFALNFINHFWLKNIDSIELSRVILLKFEDSSYNKTIDLLLVGCLERSSWSCNTAFLLELFCELKISFLFNCYKGHWQLNSTLNSGNKLLFKINKMLAIS